MRLYVCAVFVKRYGFTLIRRVQCNFTSSSWLGDQIIRVHFKKHTHDMHVCGDVHILYIECPFKGLKWHDLYEFSKIHRNKAVI